MSILDLLGLLFRSPQQQIPDRQVFSGALSEQSNPFNRFSLRPDPRMQTLPQQPTTPQLPQGLQQLFQQFQQQRLLQQLLDLYQAPRTRI